MGYKYSLVIHGLDLRHSVKGRAGIVQNPEGGGMNYLKVADQQLLNAKQ